MNSVQLLYYSKIYKNSMFFRKLDVSLKSDMQIGENKFSNNNILKNLKLKQFQLNTINKMKAVENYYYNDKDFTFKNKVGFLSDPVFTGKSFSILGFLSSVTFNNNKKKIYQIEENNISKKCIKSKNIFKNTIIITHFNFFDNWRNKFINNTTLNVLYIKNKSDLPSITCLKCAFDFFNNYDCILVSHSQFINFLNILGNKKTNTRHKDYSKFFINRLIIDKCNIIGIPKIKLSYNFCWLIHPFIDDEFYKNKNFNIISKFRFHEKIIKDFLFKHDIKLIIFINLFFNVSKIIINYIIDNKIKIKLNNNKDKKTIYEKSIIKCKNISENYLKQIITILFDIANKKNKSTNYVIFKNLLNFGPIIDKINFFNIGFIVDNNIQKSYFNCKKGFVSEIIDSFAKIKNFNHICNVIIKNNFKEIANEINLIKPTVEVVNCITNKTINEKFITDLQKLISENNSESLLKHFNIINYKSNYNNIEFKNKLDNVFKNCSEIRKKNIFDKINSVEQICPICCLEFDKINSDLVITDCCQNIFHLSCFTKSLFNLKLKCPFCAQNLKIKNCSLITNKLSENEKNNNGTFLTEYINSFLKKNKKKINLLFNELIFGPIIDKKDKKIYNEIFKNKKIERLKYNFKHLKKGSIYIINKYFFESGLKLEFDNLIILKNDSKMYNIELFTYFINMNINKKINIYQIMA